MFMTSRGMFCGTATFDIHQMMVPEFSPHWRLTHNGKTVSDETNSANGNIWKTTVNARVTDQEAPRQRPGTFQTYVIEETQAVRNIKNPTASVQVSIRIWFSPDVNHWVRRNVVRRERNLIVRNETVELVEYGRKSAR